MNIREDNQNGYPCSDLKSKSSRMQSRQQRDSKLTNRSRMMGRTMSPTDTSNDDQMMVRGTGEQSRLASRLVDVTDQALGKTGLIHQPILENSIQNRKKRSVAAGRFRSVTDALPIPENAAAFEVNKVGIPVNTDYPSAQANNAQLIAAANAAAVKKSPNKKQQSQNQLSQKRVPEFRNATINQNQNRQKNNDSATTAKKVTPPASVFKTMQIDKPVIQHVRHVSTFSTDKALEKEKKESLPMAPLKNESVVTVRLSPNGEQQASR